MTQPSSAQYLATAIQDVTQTIAEKCQVLGDILVTSESKFHSIQRQAREKVFQQSPLVQEMDRVFEQLQGSAANRSLTASDASGKTLFDYVDAETVQALQQDAVEQTKEIDEMLVMHRNALIRIAAIYEYFCSFDKKHGAQIHRVIEISQIGNATHDEVKKVEFLYDAAVRFFVDMEQCDRFLLRYFTTINDVYPLYESLFNEAETLFDELRNLRDFYRQFLSSYLQLGPELDRRRMYEDQVNTLLHDTMTKLRTLARDEDNARSNFTRDHARYLPSSLCPELKNMPDRFELVRVETNEASN